MFRLPALGGKLLDNLTPSPRPGPSPPQNSSLRVTWDSMSPAWSPKSAHRIKQNAPLLGCDLLFSRYGVVSHPVTRRSQNARLPCPSPIPGACSNSCPSSRWCHPSISPSVTPFSSCLQCFSASGWTVYSLASWQYIFTELLCCALESNETVNIVHFSLIKKKNSASCHCRKIKRICLWSQ